MNFSVLEENNFKSYDAMALIIILIKMKKQNIYLYPLEGKVIFPYH